MEVAFIIPNLPLLTAFFGAKLGLLWKRRSGVKLVAEAAEVP
jgi:hypothetical protein